MRLLALLAIVFSATTAFADFIDVGDISQVSSKTYDYVVVGGGTAGLLVAKRLSDRRNVEVAVLEAGAYIYNDSLIDTRGLTGKAQMNDSYAWHFETVPQSHLGERVVAWPRGKMLGGSSGINYLAWTKPFRDDVENWTKLFPGVSLGYKALFDASRRTENVSRPGPKASYHNATFSPSIRGERGPVQVSWSEVFTQAQSPYQRALRLAGARTQVEAADGTNEGASVTPGSVNPTNNTRSYAASAYFAPYSHRRNLDVLTGVRVDRLTLRGIGKHSRTDGPIHRATAVYFTRLADNSTHAVHANKEITKAAGAVQTPQLLELSGVGSRHRLEALNIEVKVDSPGVGENLQDRAYLSVVAELKPEAFLTTNNLSDPSTLASAEQSFYSGNASNILNLASSSLSFRLPKTFFNESGFQAFKKSVDIADWFKNCTSLFHEQYKLYRQQLYDPDAPQVEIILIPGVQGMLPSHNASFVSLAIALVHPFSRGSIHIQTNDPAQGPMIDPRYFRHKADLDLMTAAARWCTRLASTIDSAFMRDVRQLYAPNATESSTAESLRRLKANLGTEYHPVGTAAMLPRSKHGVVNDHFRVYGLENVRVVDASVVPLHVSTHLQSTVYALAEWASDLISGDEPSDYPAAPPPVDEANQPAAANRAV